MLQNKIDPEFCKVVPFAKPVKDFAFQLGWDGKKDQKGRRLLQLIGTECGRECINKDIWIKHWSKTVKQYFNDGMKIIIADDVRFDNEVDMIHRSHGYLIKVVGRSAATLEDLDHPSELGIDKTHCNHVINNSGTIVALEKRS